MENNEWMDLINRLIDEDKNEKSHHSFSATIKFETPEKDKEIKDKLRDKNTKPEDPKDEKPKKDRATEKTRFATVKFELDDVDSPKITYMTIDRKSAKERANMANAMVVAACKDAADILCLDEEELINEVVGAWCDALEKMTLKAFIRSMSKAFSEDDEEEDFDEEDYDDYYDSYDHQNFGEDDEE